LIGIAVSVCGWYLSETAATIKAIDDRVAAVELWKAETNGNRFTSRDGAEVWKEIGAIKTECARLSTNQVRVLADMSRVEELIKGQARIEARLDGIERSINRHLDGNGNGKPSAMMTP
jgi:hypothetical protein